VLFVNPATCLNSHIDLLLLSVIFNELTFVLDSFNAFIFLFGHVILFEFFKRVDLSLQSYHSAKPLLSIEQNLFCFYIQQFESKAVADYYFIFVLHNLRVVFHENMVARVIP
jgi:hypothetical protein